MRAVVIRQFGPPKQLKVEDVPTPEPRGDELLVAVKAASINPSDVKNAAGVMHGTTLPRIPGRDFAGIVTRGPADLLGREVWGTGGENGFTHDGSHAEFLAVSKTAVATKPASLSMDSAGSAGVIFITAWLSLVTTAEISAGETVVIIGAAGGVGSAAAQIATSRGARVIGVVRSDDDFPAARKNGAAEVINSRSTNIVEKIQSITNNRGANIIFDTSGMMFAEAVEIAAMDARIPIIAAPADGKSTFNLRGLYRKKLRILGVDTRPTDGPTCAKMLEQMAPDFNSGRFKADPNKSYPLTEAIAAYEEAAHGGARIILKPNS